MILYINTTLNNEVLIGLKDGDNFLAQKKFKAEKKQSEKLLVEIDKLLKNKKNKLKGIEVENRGGSFTSLRIGVATANALGYAFNIPVFSSQNVAEVRPPVREVEPRFAKNKEFNIVKPEYSGEPNIG